MRAEMLKLELRTAALDYARTRGIGFDESHTTAVIFDELKGNLCPTSLQEIQKRSAWNERTEKHHQNVKNAKEMQSSNSSDALLMSVFCHPKIGKWTGMRALMRDDLSTIEFGYKPGVAMHGGKSDLTEIDMKLPETLCEAKLTEADFTQKSAEIVERYVDLDNLFHSERLPRVESNGDYANYQIIRNLLAAAQEDKKHILICDERRPDLARSYFETVSCVRDVEFRRQCRVVFWQEIAHASGECLKAWMIEKYGMTL